METTFEDLTDADLVVDRVYRGGQAGNRGDDPISKLLPVGNAGGFRFKGSPVRDEVVALALYTSLTDADWPDTLDLETGTFTYYGDNKRPGADLHGTPRKGNLALSQMFGRVDSRAGRKLIPPIFLFAKAGLGADVIFRGLLVPGSAEGPLNEQLVAIWRTSGQERFQNYRARFSVLDVREVPRAWINSILAGESEQHAPKAWLDWRETGLARRLVAPRSIEIRTREEQLPRTTSDAAMLAAIHTHFAGRPHDFEHCAAQIWLMLAPETDELQVTRRSRDGGRDAIGTYQVGPPADRIKIDFALEAKCYAPTNSVGVREVSRLISRLRHRNFGVLITTSYVHPQAYREIREDQHPVAIVCGRDIVEVLRTRGMGTKDAVTTWLHREFPAPRTGEVDVAFDELIISFDGVQQTGAR